jgi:uncharacterized membrane protein HdeD (DUF308 family)
MVTTVREPSTTVEQELKRINQAQLQQAVGSSGAVMQAAGILEIIFGIVALAASSLTGAFFAMLLGAAMIVSGVVELVGSVARNNLGRFVLGLIGIVAGALVMAHPLYGLAFLSALIGIYLLGVGIARLFGAGNKGWTRVGGIVGIIFGIYVLAQLSTISAALIGVLVGISILIDGIITTNAGMKLRSMVSAPR